MIDVTNPRTQVNLAHIFLIAPLLIALTFVDNIWLQRSLLIIAPLGSGYHLYRLWHRLANQDGNLLDYPNIINALHIVVIFPLLFGMGWGTITVPPLVLRIIVAFMVAYQGYRAFIN